MELNPSQAKLAQIEEGIRRCEEAQRRHHAEARAQQCAEDTLPRKAAEAGADLARAAASDEGPADLETCARIRVRGTEDNEASEKALTAWERDTRIDAKANGGLVPTKATLRRTAAPRLFDVDMKFPKPVDTENELNGLIAECRLLMREVAFVSACHTYDTEDRINYLTSAQNLALTAAKIGDTIAGLRAGPPMPKIETHRHELVYMRATSQGTSPLPLTAKSDNQ
jgi:hypothetical protein